MPPKLDEHYVEFLYMALYAPGGIIVQVLNGEVQKALQGFYRTRKNLQDPRLDALTFRRGLGDENEIWLCKTKQESNAEEPEEPEASESDQDDEGIKESPQGES